MIRSIGAALAAGCLFAVGAGVFVTQANGQPPSEGDAITNPAFKRAEVLTFMQVKPGDQVADIVAGRFARALSAAVGPTGRVYAIEPTEVVKVHPEVLTTVVGLAAQPDYKNVEVISQPIDTVTLPQNLDIVFIRQNYHDLHDKFMGPADVAAFNRRVYAALKPGGLYVVLDHAAAMGDGLKDTETLHRIDPAVVKAEVERAGFTLEQTSDILANPSDPHDKFVFDPSIRGHTDQFLFRFKKPM